MRGILASEPIVRFVCDVANDAVSLSSFVSRESSREFLSFVQLGISRRLRECAKFRAKTFFRISAGGNRYVLGLFNKKKCGYLPAQCEPFLGGKNSSRNYVVEVVWLFSKQGLQRATCMALKPPLFAAMRNAAVAERRETSEAARIARLAGRPFRNARTSASSALVLTPRVAPPVRRAQLRMDRRHFEARFA